MSTSPIVYDEIEQKKNKKMKAENKELKYELKIWKAFACALSLKTGISEIDTGLLLGSWWSHMDMDPKKHIVYIQFKKLDQE